MTGNQSEQGLSVIGKQISISFLCLAQVAKVTHQAHTEKEREVGGKQGGREGESEGGRV